MNKLSSSLTPTFFDSFFASLLDFHWNEGATKATIEKKVTINSNKEKTEISYSIPGVEKSQLRVYVSNDNGEVGEKQLVVDISARESGGPGSEQKREVFSLFSYDDEEKISTSLKNGVLNIVIPKKNYSQAERVIREIEIK